MCYYPLEARQLYSVGLFFMQNMSEEKSIYTIENDNSKLLIMRKFVRSFSFLQLETLDRALEEAKSVTGFGSVEIIVAEGSVRNIKVSKSFREKPLRHL